MLHTLNNIYGRFAWFLLISFYVYYCVVFFGGKQLGFRIDAEQFANNHN